MKRSIKEIPYVLNVMFNISFANLFLFLPSLMPVLPRPNINTSGLSVVKRLPMKPTPCAAVTGL